MSLINSNLISCNSNSFKPTKPKLPKRPDPQINAKVSPLVDKTTINTPNSLKPHILGRPIAPVVTTFHNKKGVLQVCHSALDSKDSDKETVLESGKEVVNVKEADGRDWTTSVLLFFLWGVLMYYVFFLAPNQTPTRDVYFLEKLLNLRGDDGFRMNEVLVALWYIMGLWPLVYSMLLLPTGRSSKSKIPVWPFLVLSYFGGAYALLPYFVFWKPPPPPVEENELGRWPLNFLESKWTALELVCSSMQA